MHSETLQPKEKITLPQTEASVNLPDLNEAQIAQLSLSRKTLLESIKPQIALKQYYALEEKITAEEKRLKEILNIRQGKQSRLAKYSFILNTNYFEQEFLQN